MSGTEPDKLEKTMIPLFDAIVNYIPAPEGDFDAGTTIPGSDTASGQPITISNSKGALIFKYNLDGKLEWYRNIWGGSDSYIHDLYIAEDTGDIFACGRNPGSSNFVNGITCTGTGNGFVLKQIHENSDKRSTLTGGDNSGQMAKKAR